MKLKKNIEKSKAIPAGKPIANMMAATHSDKPKLVAKGGAASTMPPFGDAKATSEIKTAAAKSSFASIGNQPAFAAAIQPNFANQFGPKVDPKPGYSFIADPTKNKPKSDQSTDAKVLTKSSPPSATAFSFTKSSANAEIKSILGAAASKPPDSLPSATENSLFGGQTVFKTPSITAFNAQQAPTAVPFGGAWTSAPPMAKPTAVAFGNNSGGTTSFGKMQPSPPLPSTFGSVTVSQIDSLKSGGNIDKPIPLMAAKPSPIAADNNVNNKTTTPPNSIAISLVTKPKDKENVPTSMPNVATIQPQPQQAHSKSMFDSVIEAAVKSPTPAVAINKMAPPTTMPVPSISTLGFGQAPANVTVSSSAASGFTFSLSELPKPSATTLPSGKRDLSLKRNHFYNIFYK